MNWKEASDNLDNERLIAVIQESAEFERIKRLFFRISGIAVSLRPAGLSLINRDAPPGLKHEVCDYLAAHQANCGKCSDEFLPGEDADSPVAKDRPCFARVAVRRAPIRRGGCVIGVLEARALLGKGPEREDFAKWVRLLGETDESCDWELLADRWRDGPWADANAFAAFGDLLEFFAEHLASQCETLEWERSHRVKTRSSTTVRALEYLRAHGGESLRVSDVASALSVDLAYLSKVFKADVGMTPSAYLAARRVELAKRLLRSPMRVSEVAYQAGFSSISQFNRSFRQHVGLCPKEYRQRLDDEGVT